jgi:hypothetical protein
MRWVTAHRKGFSIQERADTFRLHGEDFAASITRRGVHEFLFHPKTGNSLPFFPALQAARAVTVSDNAREFSFPSLRKLIWIDATSAFYPPAAIAAGILPSQLVVLRPKPVDLIWAAVESLRCQSIGAVVAIITQPLTRVQARRLQLAAETGGGAAVLIRPNQPSAAPHIYAASTRWLVTSVPGTRTIQRWRLELIHGHGGHIGQFFLLEKNRALGQTHFVPLPAALADHAPAAAAS